MRKLIFLVLLIVVSTAVCAAENPNINVNIANQDPDPVEPGKIFEVSFKLDNQGGLANDVVFEILPEYPFYLLPDESPSKEIGAVGSTQSQGNSVFVKYRLKVDQNAVDGNHKIKVRYKTDPESWVKTENLTIKVQSQEAILSVEKYSTAPDIAQPGSKAKLSMTLRNYANSLLKDIKVILVLGKSGDDSTPFSPFGSTNEKVIPSVDAMSSAPLDFDLLVDSGAQSKIYKVPLNIQYSDALNKNYSKTLTLSIIVGGEPETSVYIEGTTIYTAGNTGDVTVKIVNKGFTDIKFLNVNLDNADGYKIISHPIVYIGNINSDDYETVDFRLSIGNDAKEKIMLPLTIEYKDANNQNYKKKISLALPIYTSSEAKKLGLVKGTSNFAIFLALFVIAAILFVSYRFWKRRKK